MTVYEQLQQIVAAKHASGYLNHYPNDLYVHDRRQLGASVAGDEFVWVLREMGTELFHVAKGHSHNWVTYWLTKGICTRIPHLCFHIRVTSNGGETGTVRSITYDRATKLAHTPHPDGIVVEFKFI